MNIFRNKIACHAVSLPDDEMNTRKVMRSVCLRSMLRFLLSCCCFLAKTILAMIDLLGKHCLFPQKSLAGVVHKANFKLVKLLGNTHKNKLQSLRFLQLYRSGKQFWHRNTLFNRLFSIKNHTAAFSMNEVKS